MDKGERVFRLLLEGLAVLVATLGLVALGASLVVSVFLATMMVHTLSWLFNGNFWALVQFSIPLNAGSKESTTLTYLSELQQRTEREPAIEGLVLFGSASRGVWHEFSDLDLRFVRAKGFGSLTSAALFVMRERAIAMIQRKPLDAFLADGPRFLEKMRRDEYPIFLVKRGARLQQTFPDNGPVCLIRLSDS